MNGVIYQLSGSRSMELMAASLWSLRQHYDGPVTVFCTDKTKRDGLRLADDSRLKCQIAEFALIPEAVRSHSCSKSAVYMLSPYERTIYLDADTVIQADISPLFQYSLAVTPVGKWLLTDNHPYASSIWKETRFFRKYSDSLKEMVRQVHQAPPPAINMGVFVFRRDHPILWPMHLLCVVGRTWRCTDESACHLLLPRMNDVAYVPETWNSLVRFNPAWQQQNIVHMNNEAYLREPAGRECARLALTSAMRLNVAGMAEWFGTYDHRLRALVA